MSMDQLWVVAIGAAGLLIAIGQAFVKQGDVAIREQAVVVGGKEVELDKERLAVELNRRTAERVSAVEAQNVTFSTQLTAMTQEFSKVVQQYIVTQTELATVKAENAQLRDELAQVKAELAAQRTKNAELQAELDQLRVRVTVTEGKA